MAEPNDLRGNRLLDQLPDSLRARLAPDLELVENGLREALYEPAVPIEHVWFPVSGVFSLVTLMEDGRGVEIATVGNEGMVGLPVFLQASSTSVHRAVAQVPGGSLRMRAAAFRSAIGQNGALMGVLQRYTQALFSLIAQSAACNRLHVVEERCARWLLHTHDRVTMDEFPLTQEFMSQMLGVRRPAMNVALGTLQRAGLIDVGRGRIAILDRRGLEKASCECYATISTEFARLGIA